jgi:hypothetical protein
MQGLRQKEKSMEIALPEGLVWIAAGGIGLAAVVMLARMLEAVLELDLS